MARVGPHTATFVLARLDCGKGRATHYTATFVLARLDCGKGRATYYTATFVLARLDCGKGWATNNYICFSQIGLWQGLGYTQLHLFQPDWTVTRVGLQTSTFVLARLDCGKGWATHYTATFVLARFNCGKGWATHNYICFSHIGHIKELMAKKIKFEF